MGSNQIWLVSTSILWLQNEGEREGKREREKEKGVNERGRENKRGREPEQMGEIERERYFL